MEYILLLVNLNSFIIYGVDKYKAIKGRYRISEKTLLLLALCGGAIGAIVAMIVFSHKIRKPKFYILIPLLALINIAILIFYQFK